LLDLAEGNDFAETLLEVATEKKVALVIPPTVIQEMSHLMSDAHQRKAELALTAVQNVRRWSIHLLT